MTDLSSKTADTPKHPYDYGTHECLDRTYLVMELLSYVSEHPQVRRDKNWTELAETAHSALWALYQAIGNADVTETPSEYERMCSK